MQRLNQKHEAEAEFLMKQQRWSKLEPKLPANFDFEDEINIVKNGHSDKGPVAGFTSGVDRDVSNPRRRKDERMAATDPTRYCADRCVATGNCDVFEVSFRFSSSSSVGIFKETYANIWYTALSFFFIRTCST